MLHNKKSYFCLSILLILSGILLFALVSPCAAQVNQKEGENIWWQAEIPPAAPGKMINPAYVSKREEVKLAWSQLHRQSTMRRQYYRWTSDTYNHVKRINDDRARRKVNSLKRELKKVPMYVAEGAEPDPGPAPPASKTIIRY